VKELVSIKTECYSGYKADEYPKCFMWQGVRYEVQEILDRWYQWDAEQKHPVSDYFKVKTASGDQYILKHELQHDRWYLCHPEDSKPKD
jgi:hypothetical protein